MPHQNILDPTATALVIVDIQEGFRNAIPDFALIASRASTVTRAFQLLALPVIVTEQYPKGLGKTAEEIHLVLPDDYEVIEKTTFSSCGSEAFVTKLTALGIRQIVLCGLETHVCVNQTAHDLLDRGFQVQLLIDCVCSRFEHDKVAGISKMQASGVVNSSIEMALFELMNGAGHEKFKEVQALVK